MGIWRRVLTPLEASSIYVAGISNAVSFAPAPPNQVQLTIQRIGNQVKLTWLAGNLQSADAAAGPYTTVPAAISPYTVTPAGTQKFYRVH